MADVNEPIDLSLQLDEPELSDRQRKALVALIDGKSTTESAKYAGVTPKTVRLWMKNPVFMRVFKDETGAAFSTLLGMAVKTVEEAMQADDQWLRYKAALFVIDHALKDEASVGSMTVQFAMPKPGMPQRREIAAEDAGDVE